VAKLILYLENILAGVYRTAGMPKVGTIPGEISGEYPEPK
jgi:hypothetical protein